MTRRSLRRWGGARRWLTRRRGGGWRRCLAPLLAELVAVLRRYRELDIDQGAAALLGVDERRDGRPPAGPGSVQARHQGPLPYRAWVAAEVPDPDADLGWSPREHPRSRRDRPGGSPGGSPRGQLCLTLTAADIATGWTESQSVRNKAQVKVAFGEQERRGACGAEELDRGAAARGLPALRHRSRAVAAQPDLAATRPGRQPPLPAADLKGPRRVPGSPRGTTPRPPPTPAPSPTLTSRLCPDGGYAHGTPRSAPLLSRGRPRPWPTSC